MPRLRDVTRYVRSKNAGPFWITVDIFFDGAETYGRYRDDPAISSDAIAVLMAVESSSVKRFAVDSLNVVKLSYPRREPQGGVVERDMHGGQQYVPLLDVELTA